MALRLEGVCHRFGAQAALEDVSIHVETGDCYGFIGHNGAGKTTAMRVALGLLRPDRGRVIVAGFDARDHWREARVRMGALIETAGFHGNWSGGKNLRLLDRLAGGRSDIGGLLELVGLADAGPKPVRAYSQGMRQRLGVAQALLGDPDYILLDEPTSALDPEGIREMRQLLLRLTREEGKTVLVSSHQLHELAGVCTRIGVLRQGRLVLEERLDALMSKERYALRTGADDRAREVLGAMGLAAGNGDGLVVDLGDRPPGAVLRGLVESGVEVEEFAPRPPTLEEIYHGEAEPVPPPPPIEVGRPAAFKAPRGPVRRMIAHEFRRWFGGLAVPVMLALPALAGVFAMLSRREDVASDTEEIAAGSLFGTTDINAFEGVARSLHSGVWLLCYVILGLASQSIAGEYAQGTLRNVLLRPLTRLQVALGKGMALLGITLIAYATLLGVSVLVASMVLDFKGVEEILPNGNTMPLVPASEIWPDFWRAILSPLLPLFAFAGLGFLAGTVVRRGATAVALALGLGMTLDIAHNLAWGARIEPWLVSTYVPSPLGRTSFIDHFVEVSQGTSNTMFFFEGTDVVVPLAWTLVALLLAERLVHRRYVP